MRIWDHIEQYVERLCHRVTADINPRTIQRDDKPYMYRYYLWGMPSHPDGAFPFERGGAPRERTRWPKTWAHKIISSVVLHQFHNGDSEEELHNHPWKWAVSFVLTGGYIEERRFIGHDSLENVPTFYGIEKRVVKAPAINVITSSDFHRVDLPEEYTGRTWTLFITGPKFQGWGFWNRTSQEFEHWKDFFARLRREKGAK